MCGFFVLFLTFLVLIFCECCVCFLCDFSLIFVCEPDEDNDSDNKTAKKK